MVVYSCHPTCFAQVPKETPYGSTAWESHPKADVWELSMSTDSSGTAFQRHAPSAGAEMKTLFYGQSK
jgi:hypothetical protein